MIQGVRSDRDPVNLQVSGFTKRWNTLSVVVIFLEGSWDAKFCRNDHSRGSLNSCRGSKLDAIEYGIDCIIQFVLLPGLLGVAAIFLLEYSEKSVSDGVMMTKIFVSLKSRYGVEVRQSTVPHYCKVSRPFHQASA